MESNRHAPEENSQVYEPYESRDLTYDSYQSAEQPYATYQSNEYGYYAQPSPSYAQPNQTSIDGTYAGGKMNSQYYLESSLNKENISGSVSSIKVTTSPVYNDVWAAVLFVLLSIGLVVISGFGLIWITKTDSSRDLISITNEKWIKHIIFITVFPFIFGFFISLAYFFALLKYAGKVILISIFIKLGYVLAQSVLFFIYSDITLGVMMAVVFCILSAYYYMIRGRIPFTKVLLKEVAGVIKRYPGTYFTGLFGLGIQMVAIVLFVYACVGAVFQLRSSGLLISIVIGFYWMTQVIQNTVHVTVSGLFATNYFMAVKNAAGKLTVPVVNPTLAAGKRAMTTSFGSICFGSMIVAIVKLLRFFISGAMNGGKRNIAAYLCLLCACCFMSFLEYILEYFNQYAFTQVAIYGKSYCDASKSTWKLIKDRGIDIIINESLVDVTLWLGAIITALLCGCLGVAIVALSDGVDESGRLVIVGLISGLCGFIQFSILSEVIASGTSSTFVCLAEDPLSLQKTNPVLFDKIRKVFPKVMLSRRA